MESYFDIAFCSFLNLMAFYQTKYLEDFYSFFELPLDAFNSFFVFIILILVVAFPYSAYKYVDKYQKHLHQKEVQAKYGVFYYDLNLDNYHSTMFNFYFMLRRMLICTILTFMFEYTLFQQQLMLIMCVFNMIYMINVQPFQSQTKNYIETFNELSIYIANIFVTCFLDPGHHMDFTNGVGWAIICNAGFNILVNLLLVIGGTVRDVYRSI